MGSYSHTTRTNRLNRAWVILEQDDGSRIIAEVYPEQLTLTREGALDFGGEPWWRAERVGRLPGITRLVLEGVLREPYYGFTGPVPGDAQPELEQAQEALPRAAPRPIEPPR